MRKPPRTHEEYEEYIQQVADNHPRDRSLARMISEEPGFPDALWAALNGDRRALEELEAKVRIEWARDWDPEAEEGPADAIPNV